MSSYVFWQFYSSFVPGFLSYWLHLLLLLLSCVQLFVTPWTTACQASLSFTISQSVLKLMSIESVMPSSHLMLCHPLLLPSMFPSIRVFSNELALQIKVLELQLQHQSSSEYSELISFRIDWFDLFTVQGTLKSLLQNHSSKPSILWRSVNWWFFHSGALISFSFSFM